ncbi:lambda phage tail tape-measure family protein [Escherichia coli DEC4B]|nr:lambda phage tail tape-measure family protein [Escherichia coli DEC4B]
MYGDNPAALAKATSALKNTRSAEEQLRGSWMAGLKSGWGEWAESATDSFSQVKSAATQTFDGIAQNMAAMLTGAEADWRGFTRSVLSMMTEILLKQAMVAVVGRIGSASWRCVSVVVHLLPRGRLLRLRRRTSISRPEDLRGRAANMSLRG